MSNNYDEYEYDDSNFSKRKNNFDFLEKIGVILLIVSAIIIVLMLIKGCANSSGRNDGGSHNNGGNNESEITPSIEIDKERLILSASKKYYVNNRDEYPNALGECSQVTLQTLIMNGLLRSEDWKTCNSVNTYVRVCALENGTVQYTPWFACNEKLSNEEYEDVVEGTLNNIVADSTYVDFIFLPQELQKKQGELGPVEEVWKEDVKYISYKTLGTTTYYKYRDELFKWSVTKKYYYSTSGEKTDPTKISEYYVSAPNRTYTYSDNKVNEAYKWYTTTSKKEYALASNGEKAVSTKPIGDYTHNEGGIVVTIHKTRTVNGTRKPTKYYACSTSMTSNYMIFQKENCPSSRNPEYKFLREIFYSCADPESGSDSIYGKKVNENDTCVSYSDWGNVQTGKCPTGMDKDLCVEGTATFYYWYKIVDNGDRTYYPSGASSSSGEKVYYTSAPVSGAIKDVSTKSTAYKWYKIQSQVIDNYTAVAPSGYVNATKTGDSKWTDWSKWSKSNPKISDGRNRQIESRVKIKLQEIKSTSSTDWVDLSTDYMSKDQLIKTFRDKGYNVSTLRDISNAGEIRYQLKMLVRNKKEGK